MAMVSDPQPATAASSLETTVSRLTKSVVPLSIERPARSVHGERTAGADMVGAIVEISPADIVKRRTATWPGMAAEIVQATRHDRIESRFCAPVHLLAAYERGVRHDGDTSINGLPKSTLRDLSRKLIFVPAGHEYRDWQEPRLLTRVIYFYFDPARLSADLGVADTSFAPRLFFENCS